MPTPNPDYDPNALDFQNQCAQNLERLRALTARQFDPKAPLSTEEEADFVLLTARCEANKEAFLRTFYTQHPTIQSYAEWRLRTDWNVSAPPPNFPYNIDSFDLETLRNREDVERLATDFGKAAENYKAVNGYQRLPLGQPNGITDFIDPKYIQYRTYSLRLDPYSDRDTTTLVALDTSRDNKFSLCFTHIPGQGQSVINGIEECMKIFFDGIKRTSQAQELDNPRAHQINFYIYVPPQYTQGREFFMSIDKVWRDGRFVLGNKSFVHHNSVPPAIAEMANKLLNADLDKLKPFKHQEETPQVGNPEMP